jgi:hypothetical protein
MERILEVGGSHACRRRHAEMIRKIDTNLNFSWLFAPSV